VSKQQLRLLGHNRTSECITLIRSQVCHVLAASCMQLPKVLLTMLISPPAAHEFFKVVAWVELLVIGSEVIQQFTCSVHTGRRQA
jgi:hypothetical protein